MTDNWNGRRVTRAHAIVATWLPAPCGQCGELVTGEPFVVGHVIARSIRPDLTWALDNWRPEHRACSDASGGAVRLERRRAGFSPRDALAAAQGLPVSPSRPRRHPAVPVAVRDGLAWSADAMRDHAWLVEFAEAPPEASPPLWMSPVPADAVGSYGTDAVEWIEWIEGKVLRWWQRLAIVRQLEHREDGTLCHKVVIDSAPRRSGKSVRMRGGALWRMANPDVFGEPQLVMHTGSDVAICREIQRAAWRWAEDVADWTVSRANGKEAITSSSEDRWLVRAQSAVYGYDVCLGLVDEGWDVAPATVDEGLEPATLERASPQLHLTSTAHRRATSLMRGRISSALADDDGETLLLVWAAPADADISDPEVWQAASPHWTEARRKMIGAKYVKALAGEVDPEADDPDPIEGFTAQYLNMWRLTERAAPGVQLVDAATWQARTVVADDRAPDAAAIEAWHSDGVSLAIAWREDDRAVVSVSAHDDVAGAAAALRACRFRGKAVVGASLVDDPALVRVARTSTKGRTAGAAVELGRLVAEGVVQHDGGEHLTGQVLDVRTAPGVDGPRLVSKGRADAVKAAAWAVAAARVRRAQGPLTMVLPTGVGA